MLMLSIPTEVKADNSGWQGNGPYGGDVSILAVDPFNANTIYAGTSSNFFKSTDSGNHWQEINNNILAGRVTAIAFHPTQPDTIFIGTSIGTGYSSHPKFNPSGFFKSIDGGKTWMILDNGLDHPYVEAIAIDPFDPDIIFLATFNEFFKTIDGGKTWQSLAHNTPSYPIVSAIVADNINRGTFYASSNGLLIKTTNGGKKFKRVNTPFFYPEDIVLTGFKNRTIYVGTEKAGMFKSIDGGKRWQAINNGLPLVSIHKIAISPTNPNIIYLGTIKGGLYKSTDAGANWQAIAKGLPASIIGLAIDRSDPNIVYTGSYDSLPMSYPEGVYKSIDGGETWVTLNKGMRSLIVTVVKLDEANHLIYAGTFTNGIFISRDNGVSWQPFALLDRYVIDIIINPQDPNIIYVACDSGLFKTVDRGLNWQALYPDPYNYQAQAIALDPINTETLYVAIGSTVEPGAIYKSIDGGQSWVFAAIFEQGICTLAIDPQHPDTIYAGNVSRVFKSTDGGYDWTIIGLGSPPITGGVRLVIDPISPQTVYAITFFTGELYRTVNGGQDWNKVATTNFRFTDIALDPLNRNRLYAATDYGVYISTNNGLSWNVLNNGLVYIDTFAITIDSSNQYLHVGTFGGVFEYLIY